MAVSLASLREKIRALEGGPRITRRRTPSGMEQLDQLIGGLPSPGIMEVHGPLGSGRSRLATSLAAVLTSQHRQVAWIDPLKQVYPPGLAQQGVLLHRMLLIQPSEDGSAPWVWCTEQILRSGNFPLVIVDLPYRPRAHDHANRGKTKGYNRMRSAGQQWARAAEFGCCTALVLSRYPCRDVPADVRLAASGQQLTIVRDRGGHTGSVHHRPSCGPLR